MAAWKAPNSGLAWARVLEVGSKMAAGEFDNAGSLSFDGAGEGSLTFGDSSSISLGDGLAVDAPGSSGPRPLQSLLLLLLLASGAFVGYEYMTTGLNPFDPVVNRLRELLGAPADEAAVAGKTSAAKPVTAPPPAPASGPAAPKVPTNPYANLRHRLTVVGLGMSTVRWNAEQEDVWRRTMSSGFNYEQFQTVQEVRASRLRGSDALLREALGHRKLWVRMEALIALAEFGIPLHAEEVRKALGEELPDLHANYFKRYAARSNPSIRYVLRHALAEARDGRVRLELLRALAPYDDPLRVPYLAAALLDSSGMVQRYAERSLKSLGIPTDEIAQQRDQVLSAPIDGAQEAPSSAIPEGELSIAAEPLDAGDLGFGDIRLYKQRSPPPAPVDADALKDLGEVRLRVIDEPAVGLIPPQESRPPRP